MLPFGFIEKIWVFGIVWVKKEDIIIIKRTGNCQHEKGEEGVKNCY